MRGEVMNKPERCEWWFIFGIPAFCTAVDPLQSRERNPDRSLELHETTLGQIECK